jgi:hypothetical protein
MQNSRLIKKFLATSLLTVLAGCTVLSAKSDPPIVMLWPPENPVLKLIFDKFHQQSSYAGQNYYVSDVTVENLTNKQIPRASFTVYFFNKAKVRIGEGLLQVSDLEAVQSAKIQFQFNSVGIPSSLALSPRKEMLAKTIPLKIVSVPPGAKLRVDGEDIGVTPVMGRFTVGTHQLDLTKEGYAPGSTPLEVTSDELPGGSITVELGGLSRDTIELRDGTVLLGDLISISMKEVVVRVDGKDQTYSRNQIRKIMLVERVVEQTPAVSQTAPAAQQR